MDYRSFLDTGRAEGWIRDTNIMDNVFINGSNQHGAAFAGAVISIVPMFILYVFGQKYFVEGTATSGLKG